MVKKSMIFHTWRNKKPKNSFLFIYIPHIIQQPGPLWNNIHVNEFMSLNKFILLNK